MLQTTQTKIICVCVNYTVDYSMLLVTDSQSKNVSCFCLDMAQWRSLIGQSLCNAMWSIGQTWVLASIGAVVEMGIYNIEYIETTAWSLV
jgi:hypothetical protein